MFYEKKTPNAPNTIRLSRDGDGYPEFEVRVTWGDFTVVRAVRVLEPRNDIRHLMRALASEGSLLTNRGFNEGVILAGTQDGDVYPVAEFTTTKCTHGRPDRVEFTTTAGRPIHPLDETVDVEVEPLTPRKETRADSAWN